MITETTIPAHAKGVSRVLADAGVRSTVAVRRSHDAVNVLPVGVQGDYEERHIVLLLETLEAAGYVAHRCQPMPWLIRVTAKRARVRS